MVQQQGLPAVSKLASQSLLAVEPQAEGQRGRFRQFGGKSPLQQPLIGFQPADSGSTGMKHKPQGILTGQQGQTVPAQILRQLSPLDQARLQSSASN